MSMFKTDTVHKENIPEEGDVVAKVEELSPYHTKIYFKGGKSITVAIYHYCEEGP